MNHRVTEHETVILNFNSVKYAQFNEILSRFAKAANFSRKVSRIRFFFFLVMALGIKYYILPIN